jgi:hypothetical protein
MTAAFLPLLTLLGLPCAPEDSPSAVAGSFLYQPAYRTDDVWLGPARPYLPQPGDIFLASDRGRIARAAHWVVGAGGVHHSGIVFARPDGSLAILEAGPHNTIRVQTLDVLPHLRSYEGLGEKVWIRQRRVPLTPEQSERLTAWALAQDGKPFAVVRLAGQLTPFRSRGPLRTYLVGGPHGGRRSYFCSELVMESCVAAGLVDPARARPAATYPRDLFMDRSYNPYLNRHLDLSPCWFPPARWASCP